MPTPSEVKGSHGMNLENWVMLPTPIASDWKSGSPYQLHKQRPPNLKDVAAGLDIATSRAFNPHLVEAMMGFPLFWTDVCLHTQRLIAGSPQPQSPLSIGSVVARLQHFRSIAKKNIAQDLRNWHK
ncbi:hypothetical protein LC605_32745 [Nostoc sp. CHAB 5836]|uniref:hypothetical protein n=1 Tax=Nostoc sp. CHAB 5836 TaxID=2780404 RepID=UPI001E32F74C|nr:hypothetical protein [Nostoc sp. CHAB 5836]MCC5619710.1 hypothetical protein [Nostoc sp. CHAB 5836]